MSKTLITVFSSASDVQEFLVNRKFDENIMNNFTKFDGEALLGLTETSLLRLCGNGEGDRLLGILNSIKALSSQGLKIIVLFLS